MISNQASAEISDSTITSVSLSCIHTEYVQIMQVQA